MSDSLQKSSLEVPFFISLIPYEGEEEKKEEEEKKDGTSHDDLKKQNQQLLDELAAIKKRSDLTEQERSELDDRLEKMQSKLITKEEQAKRDAKKLRDDYESRLKTAEQERDEIKKKYESSTIQRSLMDAAVEAKAANPNHIVAILGASTQLNDEGVVVKYTDKNEKGETVELELTPKEAVKRMKESEEHEVLFITEGSGGTGNNNSRKQEIDVAKLARDPVAFRKASKEGRLPGGL